MAQPQSASNAVQSVRPTTPPKPTPLNTGLRLSPTRIPDQIITTSSFKNGHMNLDTFSPVNQHGSFEFDRVLRSGRVLRRTKKKGAWKPSWKAAYLVLRPNLLSIYKNSDETELRASITLGDVTAVARVKKSNTDNVFGVFTPAKNYHFSGMNELDTSDWVTQLRVESRLENDEELELHAPEFPPKQNVAASDTTDWSAEEEYVQPGSPEGPQWSVRGNKSRVGSTSQRKPSGLRDYSGNETFTTSQSDLSDANPHAGHGGPPLSSSFSRSKTQLAPIPDNGYPVSRPSFQRSQSQLSISQVQAQAQAQTQVQSTTPAQQQQQDLNRVIRQNHLQILKSVPGTGVRQWKSVWTVLRPSCLALYKSSSEYEPIKIIPISDIIDAAEIDPVSKNKRNCLQVIGLEKTLRFSVETEAELEGWLGALKSVIVKKNRPRGHSAAATSSGLIMGGPVGGSANPSIESIGPAAAMVQQVHAQAPPTISHPRTSQQLLRTGSELGGIVEGLENVDVRSTDMK